MINNKKVQNNSEPFLFNIYSMKQRKYISTSILEYLSNKNKVYRGIGDRINKTYGGVSDDGMGTFWTDNLTMANGSLV